MVFLRNNVSFGALLRTLRRRQRLTQQALAEALGIHRRTLIRWEQGEVLPDSKAMVLELARCLKLTDQETRQLLEASLTALTPFWSVPYPRNLFFTGREEILEALHAQLRVDQAVALTQSSALHGLGGVGKTQITLEYAYRHALEYSAVFWIGAETNEQMVASLLRVAEILQLPERENNDQQRVVVAVQRWLSTHGQWLMIWDNVEDLHILQRFLPAARSGAILLTTRLQVLGTLAQGLDLSPMEQEDAILLLLRRAKVLAPDTTREQMHQFARQAPAQYAVVAELATELGRLPLALDQAGAYLEETRCGFPAYLALLRTRRATLLHQRGEGVDDHPASVFTTFTLGITATAQRHPAVRDLLQICALLQPDAIPEEIFRQGGEYLGPQLQAVCRDSLEWDRVVGLACAYSLLSRQPEEQMLSLHRLVQAVLLESMTETERAQWNSRVIGALEAAFPETQPTTGYPLRKQCDRLLPHALHCLRQAEAAEQSLPLASLAYKTAHALCARARYREAEALYLSALKIREQALGPTHPAVASSLHSLALLSWRQSKYGEAERLSLRSLAIREQVLGPNHPEVADSLSNLATLYGDQGRYTEAEALHLSALRLREQLLGPDHLQVALSLNNLSALYVEQGRYAEAEPLCLRALQLREQVLGPDHAAVAFPLNNLAELYRERGKETEAEQIYQRVLHIWEKTLGMDHPHVAHPLNGLADLYQEQGKYLEAEAFYRRALAIREQRLGSQHLETAETLHRLALLRQKQGHLSEALSYAARALSIRSQASEEAHPKTVATRTLYHQLLQEQAETEGESASELPPEATLDAPDKEHHTDLASSPLHQAVLPASYEDDPLQDFLDMCCELHQRAWCRSADLWQAYEQWVTGHQERFPLTRRVFAMHLKAQGCRADHTHEARIWRGITVVKQER